MKDTCTTRNADNPDEMGNIYLKTRLARLLAPRGPSGAIQAGFFAHNMELLRLK